MNINRSLTLDKSCVYLNVFCDEQEYDKIPVDLLADVRGRYFAGNGKRIKDKLTFTANNVKYVFSCQMDSKGKFKWKALANDRVTEEAVTEPAGYIIIYKTSSGVNFKKAYFNHSHIWQKTEYFAINSSEPVISLMPWLNDERVAIAMYDNDSSFPQILYAMPVPQDESEISQAVAICRPPVSANVNGVTYYFGDEDAEKQWLNYFSDDGENSSIEFSQQSQSKMFFDVSAVDSNDSFKNLADTTEVFSIKPTYKPVDVTKTEYAVIKEKTEIKEETPIVETNEQSFKTSRPATINIPLQDNNTVVSTSSDSSSVQPSKEVVLSSKEKGAYFGTLDSKNNRRGYGRTQNSKGQTLYEGEYLNDMKNGFGVTYFKSGKVAYVGNHINDYYNGFGIEFRATDGSIAIGDFKDSSREFISAKFDKLGKLSFASSRFEENTCNINVNLENGDIVITGNDEDGPIQSGTILSADGGLVYNGDLKNGAKDGYGTLFNPDGSIKYVGDFKRNAYHGNGTLKYEDGTVYSGDFTAGLPNGKGELKSETGAVIYTGQWKKGLYSGDGRLYNKDGSYCDGKFLNGISKGKLTVYDENGTRKYTGTLIDNLPDGSGICYQNGEKLYDGQLSGGVKSGTGRLYENGECVYMGSFENDMFSGFGISYKNATEVYCGMWSENKYNGSGALRISDTELVVGNFLNGVPHGRINVVVNDILVQECIYNNGECEYMREYSPDGTSVIYDGNIRDNHKEGMGCTFTEYGEKIFEGIFRNGEPSRSMKVSSRELTELEFVLKLKDTDYERFRHSKEFVVEQPMLKGVYSGQLKDGLPYGKGTILYVDHRYTGMFKNGVACGSGVIYFGDGTEVSGMFAETDNADLQKIKFADVTYYKI